MLKIYYGDIEADNYIFNPDVFFNNSYEDGWIVDQESREMIKDIDGSDVIGPRAIDSPFLGSISTERLSGGVKTLILMKFDSDHIFNASACGDNCAPFILELAHKCDLTINLRHIMDFGDDSFDLQIINTGEIVHSMKELVPIAGRYV